jgi:hypothetical protein
MMKIIIEIICQLKFINSRQRRSSRLPKRSNRLTRRSNHSTKSLFTPNHSLTPQRPIKIIIITILTMPLKNQVPNMAVKIHKTNSSSSKSITILKTATWCLGTITRPHRVMPRLLTWQHRQMFIPILLAIRLTQRRLGNSLTIKAISLKVT